MLELTAAALTPAYAAVTNELLVAVKAWPGFDQAPQRAIYRESFAVERAFMEAEAVGGSIPLALGRRAFKATDPQTLSDEIKRRWANGMHVGNYYTIALEMHLAGVKFSLAELKHEYLRSARRNLPREFVIGPSTLRDITREYRPAVHLWVAHYWMQLDLTPPDIPEYLALAELIADQLLAIQMKGHGRLIDPHTPLWRVPVHIHPLLPPFSVAIQRVKPGTKLLDLFPLPM
jgi:hypothetical protein